ncbi:CpaD family pilus assembly protein [Sphingomonas cannabina]|uniref:CpaD family pilus assembly protein n=1 Tax=Sphingomonas cannabina TaxID=2899123 RepID=UPI001F2F93D2|nr:CpaD family pilus assembly lipoprotein [Sphingomonas cannabina]UIJ44548.1 CpaD family pilus assembly protein [Sphingomonas cannabina]
MPGRLLALLAPALLLGGCGVGNRDLESVHQPVVSRADYALDLAVSGDGLASGERQRLAGWLASLNVGYGDRIAVDDGSQDYAGGVHAAVTDEAAHYGLLVNDKVPVIAGPLTPGTARVVVSRMTASVPGCPDHSGLRGSDLNANTWSNYGCATNTNLAAMVARPEDLIRGQQGDPTADTMTTYKAVTTFRAKAPTGAGDVKRESTKGGN